MKWWLLVLALLVAAKLHHEPVPAAMALQGPPQPRQSDAECLASAIYHEANAEPLEGQRAVYEVVMHRAQVEKKSVCAVVKAPAQFSWVGLKPFLPLTKPMKDMLKRVKSHPKVLDSPAFRWFFSGSLPRWAKDMECRAIGNHNFCKQGEKNNNGSNWQVRDQGESPQEVPKLSDGDRLHDLRNRVPSDRSGRTEYAQEPI